MFFQSQCQPLVIFCKFTSHLDSMVYSGEIHLWIQSIQVHGPCRKYDSLSKLSEIEIYVRIISSKIMVLLQILRDCPSGTIFNILIISPACIGNFEEKNPTYWRHWISWPMLIVGSTVRLRFRKSISGHHFQTIRKLAIIDFQYHREVIYSI